MGEYATRNSDGEQVKIGTCESMYYLRADQAREVTARPGNVDPVKDALSIRFRFMFPDEDEVAPGEFEDYERGFNVAGFVLGDDYEGHGSIQLSSNHPTGWLLSVPCPLGPAGDGPTVHRNGASDGVQVIQQKWQESGDLWTVVRCAACSGQWRLPWEDAARLVVAIRSEADRKHYGYPVTGEVDEEHPTDQLGHFHYYNSHERQFRHAMADRITEGYAEGREEMGEMVLEMGGWQFDGVPA